MKNNIKIEKPGHINIKNVIAEILCIIIDTIIERNPLLSTVVTVLTLENSMDKTIKREQIEYLQQCLLEWLQIYIILRDKKLS